MIQFKKLRLSGFKSFVDKTELEIGVGLTGIVGPNGCGKSNTVEALRWVMGENSSKRMRGGGSMEDVIFNGTDRRPQRNFAEVSLLLDNSSRTAPPAYNSEDEIEVTRKIERDQGSVYKINGKVVRARDVQMLFADTVTGANSPALVSQGRVTAMINAKPQQRRMILEESAGVSGLYARRHEAELRLRAADQNLQRVQDLIGSMEGRYNALKKQAREAIRYKNLSEEIKQLEVTIAWLEWQILSNKINQARSKFDESERQVADHMTTVTQLTKTQNAQAEDLPALRHAEAEAAAALQANKMALQRLEDQEQALQNQIREAKEQLSRLLEDREHEQHNAGESAQTLEKLTEEVATIQENEGRQEDTLAEKTKIRDDLEEKVVALEEDYEKLMSSTAEKKAARQSLEKQISSDESRLLVATERQEALTQDLEQAKAKFNEDNQLGEIKAALLTLEQEVTSLTEDLAAAETSATNARSAVEESRAGLQDIEKKKAGIETEINTLQSILQADSQSEYRPVLDDIQAEKGFETALSRALGDTLMASTEADAPVLWLERSFNESDFPALPAGVQTLEPHVQAPSQLKAALMLIGVVETSTDGQNAAAQLKPGQSIVSKDGAYWRWDGLHIKAEATDRHALQLEQKNRLSELMQQAPALDEKLKSARTAYEQAMETRKIQEERRDSLQKLLRETESSLKAKQNELNRQTEERSGLFADMARLEDALKRCAEDIQAYTASVEENTKALTLYDEQSLADQSAQTDALREKLTDARTAYGDAVRELDRIQQERRSREARMQAIADERVNLENRSIRARERIKDLDAREITLKEKLESLENSPGNMGEERQSLMDRIAELEKTRGDAADKLAVIETELAQTTKALKEAESHLNTAREGRAGAQATVAAGEEQLTEMVEAIISNFDKKPEDLAEDVKIKKDLEDLPEIEPLKSKKEKMIRSRDQIGAVNLRAETEAAELEQQLGGIFTERDDLIQAIDELRGGINKLNKEARQRLMDAFGTVDGHFQELFTKLFNGGKAHLKLIESDDPLEAGLEIFAQPPGKTLQSLSLLSGGEQTLASIALIFAMFLTNPSPICVLDEIDAPLDDANVDRVCNLLDDIITRGKTRFLIITHHRLTMARMDRLYGVTMAERGVSQLVSVDLSQQSLDFLDEAA